MKKKKRVGKDKPTEVIFVFEMHLHPSNWERYLEVYKQHGKPDVIALEVSQEVIERLKKLSRSDLEKLKTKFGVKHLEPHTTYKKMLEGDHELLEKTKVVGIDPFVSLAFSPDDLKYEEEKTRLFAIETKEDFYRYYDWLSNRDDTILQNIKKLIEENPGKRIYVHLGGAHHFVYEELSRYVRKNNSNIKIKSIPLYRDFFTIVGYPKQVRMVYPVMTQLYRLMRYGRLEGLSPKDKEKVIKSYIKETKKQLKTVFTILIDKKTKTLEVPAYFSRPWGKKSWMLLQELRKKPKSRKKGFFERLKEKFSRRSRTRR